MPLHHLAPRVPFGRVGRSALLVLLASSMAGPAAQAADGLPVVTAPGTQTAPSVTLSDNFHYVAWRDLRRSDTVTRSDIYVAQFGFVIPARKGGPPTETQGGSLWPGLNGLPACASGTAGDPFAVPDDSAGVLVLWPDAQAPAGVYAQRMLEDGAIAPGFPANGKSVVAGAGLFAACSDGEGGAYFVRTVFDFNTGFVIARVTRITRDGVPAPGWTANGISVGGDEIVEAVGIEPDPSGGAIVGLRTYFNGIVDIRITSVKRVSPAGVITVAKNLPNWHAPLPGVLSATFVADGTGGFFTAWNEGPAPNHYAQHWTAAGAKTFPDSLTAPLLGPLIPDDAGGVYLVGHAKGTPDRLAILRRDGVGAVSPGWNPAGFTLAEPATLGAVRSYGLGSTLVLWSEDRGEGEDFDIRVTRVKSDGTLVTGYPVGGEPLCDMPGDQTNPVSAGGFQFFVWEDDRNAGTSGRDLYATYFLAPAGQDDVPPLGAGTLAIRSVIPNPARSGTSIALALAPGAPARLELVDVRGRIVRRQDLGVGTTAAPIATRGLSAGLYFVRVIQGDAKASARLVVVE